MHPSPLSVCHQLSTFIIVHTGRQDQVNRRTHQEWNAHDANNSQSNSIPNPSHTHQHHCKRRHGYYPVGRRSTVVIALFAFVLVSNANSTSTSKGRPSACWLLAGRQKGGDKLMPAAMLRDVTLRMFVPPTITLPKVLRPPIPLYIFFMFYERTIPPLVFPSPAHC